MNVHSAFAGAAGLISLALTGATFERWLQQRTRHLAAWTLSLLLFAGGAIAAWFGAATGWNEPTFRAFYLLGAILNVPMLGVGTIYLLGGRKIGDRAAAVAALLSTFAIGVLWVAPMHGELSGQVLPQGSEVFEPLPRVLAVGASTSGALVVALGAVLSLWKLRGTSGTDRRSVTRLATGNCLVALAIIVLSAGGLFNSIGNEMTAFSVSLAVGAALLFSGFMTATSARDNRPAKGQPEEVPTTSVAAAPSAKLDEDVDDGGEQHCSK